MRSVPGSTRMTKGEHDVVVRIPPGGGEGSRPAVDPLGLHCERQYQRHNDKIALHNRMNLRCFPATMRAGGVGSPSRTLVGITPTPSVEAPPEKQSILPFGG